MQKMQTYKLVYIIRAFNEADVIAETIANLRRDAPPGEIIVVDDGSIDDTRSIAVSAGATVLTHIMNRGGGAALQTGLTYARLNDVDIAVTFDADGQHDPNDVPALIEPIVAGKYEVVLASRFIDGASTSNMPWVRRMTLKAAVFFTKIMSQIHVTDAHNGLRAFSRRAIHVMHTNLDGMAYASEIYDQIYRNGLSHVEAPCHIRYTDYSLAKGQRSRAAVRIGLRFFLEKMRPRS